jgi:alpha-tubulin suppressor-like RCC1 family protein
MHSRIKELAMSRWRHRFVIQPVRGLGVQEVTAVNARRWSSRLACVSGSAALILGLAAGTAAISGGGSEMSIWRAMRDRVRAAAGIVLAVGVAAGAAGVAGPAQAQPVLRLPPRSAAVSWGDNQHGQLGNGTTTASGTYAGVSGLSSGVAQVSAGFDNSMALTAGGTVWTWGNGLALGTGSTADSTVPVQVPGLAGITQIAAGQGFFFDLALRSDGTVWAWGFNILGQLGDGNTAPALTPVQVTGLTGVTQIAAGYGFSLALRSDGTVWAWGWNRNGVLGDGTPAPGASDVPVQVPGLSNVTQIAAGETWAMAVRVQARRGSVVRTVWTWGGNSFGQLGDGTTTDSATPVEVSGINVPAVTAISAGGGFSMVLGSDGSVWGWGTNREGELGNGTTASQPRPAEILDGAVTAISAGYSHALALLRGGSVLAWGDGLFGPGTSSLTPKVVPSLAGVTQISAGADYSLAVHQVVLVFVPGTLQR